MRMGSTKAATATPAKTHVETERRLARPVASPAVPAGAVATAPASPERDRVSPLNQVWSLSVSPALEF